MTVIKGMDRLLKKIDALSGNSQKALFTGVRQGIKLVQGEAKMLAPVGDSGRLRNSIQEEVKVTDTGVVGKVSTNVEYAPYVEFGTGQRGEDSPSPPKADIDLSYRQDWAGMDAQPYLYPAIKQNEDTIRKMVADNLRKEIRKLGGK